MQTATSGSFSVFVLATLIALPSLAIADDESDRVDRIQAVCDRIESQLGFRCVFRSPHEVKATWKIDYEPLTTADYPRLLTYLTLFEEEFSRYPREFIHKTRLKTVVFVKALAIAKQPRNAVPDYHKEVLYYDAVTPADRGEPYQRHVIHHEYYHMIEQQMHGSAYFKDPQWAAFNAPDFKYGRGGRFQRARSSWLMRHPAAGFINGYAMSGLEEDKAEVWAVLFVADNWNTVSPWLADDPILASKVEYLQRFATNVSSTMDGDYWANARKARLPPASPSAAGVREDKESP